MPFPKIVACLLLLTTALLPATAQKARYTNIIKGYDIRIAGLVKNRLHAWSGSSEQSFLRSRSQSLTLHIFSPDMNLVKEQTFKLDQVSAWSIDFQMSDTGYYALLYYDTDKRNYILLQVDEEGNITNVSSAPAVWTKNILPEGSIPFSTTIRKDKNLFIVSTETLPVADSANAAGITPLPGESIKGGTWLGKLSVKKINTESGAFVLQLFGSGTRKLYNPLIHVTDSVVLVAALAEQTANEKKASPAVFLAKLDTSLTDNAASTVLLKGKKGKTTRFIRSPACMQ